MCCRWIEEEKQKRAMVMKFTEVYSADSQLVCDVLACKQRDADPIVLVADFAKLKDDISVASTASNTTVECAFFEMQTLDVPSLWRYCRGTKADMNPLSGYEIVPELEQQFRAFVLARDARLAETSALQVKIRLNDERSSVHRQDPSLQRLFDAVVDTFVFFIEDVCDHKHQVFGFKYCPTPGCSADKATGTLESGGVGCAVMRRLQGKGFPSLELSPYGREFKEWVANFRRAYGVPESFICNKQIKQIDLRKAPARHHRCWSSKIHRRHNADNYLAFEKETLRMLNSDVSCNGLYLFDNIAFVVSCNLLYLSNNCWSATALCFLALELCNFIIIEVS